jgi:excisionase family DNA binding protein
MKETRTTYKSNIPGKYSVNEAAALLEVSGTLVNQLIHSGSLDAIKTAGGIFLVDAQSLNDYALIRKGRGRPWKPKTAWAALWLLSGLEANWLTYPQRRRLLIRLKTIEPEEFIWLLRKRSKTSKLWVSKSVMPKISKCLSLTGKSSSIINELGLTNGSDSIEGYIYDSRMESTINKYHLLADGDTNAILHAVDSLPFNLEDFAEMPEAVVVADLCNSSVTRERSAGLIRLKELLSESRQTAIFGR